MNQNDALVLTIIIYSRLVSLLEPAVIVFMVAACIVTVAIVIMIMVIAIIISDLLMQFRRIIIN